jgi:hypothetical protein
MAYSPRDKISWVGNVIRSNTDMALLDKLNCLISGENGTSHGLKKGMPTALTVSAIFEVTMMTARRRLQNAATVSLLSTSLSFACELRTPMS